MKCYQCPVAFHKECLKADGYRGKWLCYLCKVVKRGIYEESEVVSLPGEPRLCQPLARILLDKRTPIPAFSTIAGEIIGILCGYSCSEHFRDKLKSVVEQSAGENSSMTATKERFIERVLDVIPEEGVQAFYTLRLFESLVTSDEVFDTA